MILRANWRTLTVRVAALIAAVFGAATVASGASVLFGEGAVAAGNYLPFVLLPEAQERRMALRAARSAALAHGGLGAERRARLRRVESILAVDARRRNEAGMMWVI